MQVEAAAAASAVSAEGAAGEAGEGRERAGAAREGEGREGEGSEGAARDGQAGSFAGVPDTSDEQVHAWRGVAAGSESEARSRGAFRDAGWRPRRRRGQRGGGRYKAAVGRLANGVRRNGESPSDEMPPPPQPGQRFAVPPPPMLPGPVVFMRQAGFVPETQLSQ